MIGLRETQQSLQDWIMGDASVARPKVMDAAGLDVYHAAYRARLREALGETFEKSWAWLGDEGFDQSIAEFVEQQQPTGWGVGQYGEALPPFLAVRFPDDAEVAELAELEWRLHLCFSGPDATPVDPEQLGDIDWERAKLTLVPTYSEVEVTTNVASIWRALAGEAEPPPATRLDGPMKVRIWRKGFSPQFKVMGPVEACALSKVRQGVPFGKTCSILDVYFNASDPVPLMGALLSEWLSDGVFSAIG
jgi:Putative DNA-binding domain